MNSLSPTIPGMGYKSLWSNASCFLYSTEKRKENFSRWTILIQPIQLWPAQWLYVWESWQFERAEMLKLWPDMAWYRVFRRCSRCKIDKMLCHTYSSVSQYLHSFLPVLGVVVRQDDFSSRVKSGLFWLWRLDLSRVVAFESFGFHLVRSELQLWCFSSLGECPHIVSVTIHTNDERRWCFTMRHETLQNQVKRFSLKL